MQQKVFKDILHASRNERALPIEKQSDKELRLNITAMRAEWHYRQGTQAEHKRYNKIMAELLRRQKERQNC